MTTTQLEDSDWRKQPWVWFVIGVLVFTALASFSLLFIAASNPPDMVVKNYANIEELTEQTREQDRAALALGLNADVTITASGDTHIVRIALTSRQPIAWPDQLSVKATNSTREDLDSNAVFQGVGGIYSGELKLPRNAYYLRIEPPAADWRLTRRVVGRHGQLTIAPYDPETRAP